MYFVSLASDRSTKVTLRSFTFTFVGKGLNSASKIIFFYQYWRCSALPLRLSAHWNVFSNLNCLRLYYTFFFLYKKHLYKKHEDEIRQKLRNS